MKEILLHNNNRPVISTLSRRYLRSGRSRNLIAVLAIALTTMMFTSLFTIGSSVLNLQQQQTMRQVGGSSHGGFKYLTWAEYDTLRTHPDVKAYGASIFAASATNPALSKLRTELRWSDENYARWGFSMPTTGSLPQARYELATSTLVLDALGIPHTLGTEVPLEFVYQGKTYRQTFTLCGYWQGDPVMTANAVLLSRAYIDSVVTISGITFADRADRAPEGTLMMNVMLSNALDIERKLNTILTDCGFAPGRMSTGANWAYLGSGAPDPAVILIAGVALLLITGAGYLIIYNVFYISVTKDIRNYGLLKTLGTTPRQLRRLVRRQALLLSVAGIPLGILAGYGLGHLLLPTILRITSLSGVAIVPTLNLWVPLGSALFALATVWISCRKPCHLAATVSPIEAMRTHETSTGGRKSRRSGHLSAPYMAWHNVTRNKKRVLSVVLSLALSVVLLNSVYTATRSFDMNKYLQDKVFTDFSIGESSMLTQFDLAHLSGDTIADLSGLPGVTSASTVYMQEYMLPPEPQRTAMLSAFLAAAEVEAGTADTLLQQAASSGLPVHLYGVDQFVYDRLQFLGEKPSWEAFCSGDYVLSSPFAWDDTTADTPLHSGETVTLTDRDGAPRQYTVLALAQVPYSTSPQHRHISDIALILPSDRYLDGFLEDSLIYLHLAAEASALPALEQTLRNYCSTRTAAYTSRAIYVAEFQQMQRTYLVVGGTLGGILGLVGVLNFINSIVTSILTRRQELAMLQSVGMTTRQLRRMLTGEGLWYLALTAGLALTLGNLFSALLTNAIAGQIWFFSFHFTVAPMLLCLCILLLPALAIPMLAYRSVCSQSVVERLREA